MPHHRAADVAVGLVERGDSPQACTEPGDRIVSGGPLEPVPRDAWDAAAQEFTQAELATLVALIVTINAWNGVGVTTRAWTPTR